MLGVPQMPLDPLFQRWILGHSVLFVPGSVDCHSQVCKMKRLTGLPSEAFATNCASHEASLVK